jgi:hypothetical protein
MGIFFDLSCILFTIILISSLVSSTVGFITKYNYMRWSFILIFAILIACQGISIISDSAGHGYENYPLEISLLSSRDRKADYFIFILFGIIGYIIKWPFSISDLLAFSPYTGWRGLFKYQAFTFGQIALAIILPVLILKIIQRYCDDDPRRAKGFCLISFCIIGALYCLPIMTIVQFQKGLVSSLFQSIFFLSVPLMLIIGSFMRWKNRNDDYIIDGGNESNKSNRNYPKHALSPFDIETREEEGKGGDVSIHPSTDKIERLFAMEHYFYTFIQISLAILSFMNLAYKAICNIPELFGKSREHYYYYGNRDYHIFLIILVPVILFILGFIPLTKRMSAGIAERTNKIASERLLAMEISCTLISIIIFLSGQDLFQVLYVKLVSWTVMSHYREKSSNWKMAFKMFYQNAILVFCAFVTELAAWYCPRFHYKISGNISIKIN